MGEFHDRGESEPIAALKDRLVSKWGPAVAKSAWAENAPQVPPAGPYAYEFTEVTEVPFPCEDVREPEGSS